MSLILINESILFSSAIIGIVCGMFTYFGALIGKKSKKYLGHYAEKFGAFILAVIAISFVL